MESTLATSLPLCKTRTYVHWDWRRQRSHIPQLSSQYQPVWSNFPRPLTRFLSKCVLNIYNFDRSARTVFFVLVVYVLTSSQSVLFDRLQLVYTCTCCYSRAQHANKKAGLRSVACGSQKTPTNSEQRTANMLCAPDRSAMRISHAHRFTSTRQ